MSKPHQAYQDQSALAKKTRHDYIKRMLKDKYWKRGYKAGQKKLSCNENPYRLNSKIRELIRKKTLWEMGHEEAINTPDKKRLKQMEKKKHGKHKHK